MDNTRTCPACRLSYPPTNRNLCDGMPNKQPEVWYVTGHSFERNRDETMALLVCPNCGTIRFRIEDE